MATAASSFQQRQICSVVLTRLWYMARMANVRAGLTASSTTRFVRLQEGWGAGMEGIARAQESTMPAQQER